MAKDEIEVGDWIELHYKHPAWRGLALVMDVWQGREKRWFVSVQSIPLLSQTATAGAFDTRDVKLFCKKSDIRP